MSPDISEEEVRFFSILADPKDAADFQYCYCSSKGEATVNLKGPICREPGRTLIGKTSGFRSTRPATRCNIRWRADTSN